MDPDLRWITLIYARWKDAYARYGWPDATRVSSYTGYTSCTLNQSTKNIAGRVASSFIANSFYTLFPMKRSLHPLAYGVHPIFQLALRPRTFLRDFESSIFISFRATRVCLNPLCLAILSSVFGKHCCHDMLLHYAYNIQFVFINLQFEELKLKARIYISQGQFAFAFEIETTVAATRLDVTTQKVSCSTE